MKKYKWLLIQLPEYYLIAFTLLAAYALPLSSKPIAIILAVILTLQILYKNKTTGHIIASLFLIGNLFLLLALTSGLDKVPTFNVNAKQLFFVVFFLFGFNIFISGLMLYKYTLDIPVILTPYSGDVDPPQGLWFKELK